MDFSHVLHGLLSTRRGDASLDGFISQPDLDAVLLNWGQLGTGWATGNFDGNIMPGLGAVAPSTTGPGITSMVDLDYVLLNWGWDTDTAAPVNLGTQQHDVIYGFSGDDTIDGGDGNDFIWGGAGNDLLSGGPGRDTLLGGVGVDSYPDYDRFRDDAVTRQELDDDGDKVTNYAEVYGIQTDPLSHVDSDLDELPDDWEVLYGLDPSVTNDTTDDDDLDGLTTLDEYNEGTDPSLPDTDGDGVGDEEDDNPTEFDHYVYDGAIYSPEHRFQLSGQIFAGSEAGVPYPVVEVNGNLIDLDIPNPFFGSSFADPIDYSAGNTFDISVSEQGFHFSAFIDAGISATPGYINHDQTDYFFSNYAAGFDPLLIGLPGNNWTELVYYSDFTDPLEPLTTAYIIGRSTDTLVVPVFDVDVDSDNDDGQNLPSRSDREGALENGGVQKNIPISATGEFNGHVPVVLELSENVSDIPHTSLQITVPDYDTASFSLYRDISYSELVSPGTYAAASLGLTPGNTSVWYLKTNGVVPVGTTFDLLMTATIGFNNEKTGVYEEIVLQDKIQAVANLAIDLDIDSDNDDGFGVASQSAEEDGIEDTSGDALYPGKVLLVNDADTDLDGVPDFADGFGSVQSEDDASGKFVPVSYQILGYGIASDDNLSFSYSASDPGAITIDTQNPWDTQPAAGSLRLWTKPGESARDERSILDGGDYIPSDTPISVGVLQNLTSDGVLYLESVRPSVAVADHAIEMIVTQSGSGVELGRDLVRATSVSYDLVRLDGGQAVSGSGTLAPSTAAPTVQIGSVSVANVRPSADQSRLLADITLSGSVASDLADMLSGPDGTISTAKVYLNDLDDEFGTLSLNVSKTTDLSDWLKPYPYAGTFSQTFTGVELSNGVNVIRVDVVEPTTEAVGSHDASFNVDVAYPDPETFRTADYAVALDMNQVSATPGPLNVLGVTATYAGQTFNGSLAQDANDPTIFSDGTNTIRFFNEADIAAALDPSQRARADVYVSLPALVSGLALLPVRETSLTSNVLVTHVVEANLNLGSGLDTATADQITAQIRVNNDSWQTWTLTETGTSTQVFTAGGGTQTLSLSESSSGVYSSASLASAATGDESIPLSATGNDNDWVTDPAILETTTSGSGDYTGATLQTDELTITESTAGPGDLNAYVVEFSGPEDYFASNPFVEFNGQGVSLIQSTAAGGNFYIANPDNSQLPLTIASLLEIDYDEDVTIAELLDVHPLEEIGLDAFLIGFAEGAAIGLKESTIGVVQALNGGRKAVGEYLGYLWAVNIGGANDLSLVERPKVRVFLEGVTELGGLIWDLYQAADAQRDQLIRNLITGNWDAVSQQVSNTNRESLELAAEVYGWVIESLENQSDRNAGKILGQASFEIASLLIPGGQVTKLTKLQALQKLQNAKFIQAAGLNGRLTNLTQALQRVANRAGGNSRAVQNLTALMLRNLDEADDSVEVYRDVSRLKEAFEEINRSSAPLSTDEAKVFAQVWTELHYLQKQTDGFKPQTYAQLTEALSQTAHFSRGKLQLDVHHAVPEFLIKEVLGDQYTNHAPAMLLDWGLHRASKANRPTSFHSLWIEAGLPWNDVSLRAWKGNNGPMTSQRLKDELEDIYTLWTDKNGFGDDFTNALLQNTEDFIDNPQGWVP